MINEYLQKKIDESKEALKVAADMSKEYYQAPLIITYSGGKDSDAMLQLALECLKPDEFEVFNSHTTVDAPETVYYIRDKFKELNGLGVKTTIKYPHYKDGTPMSMWNLIENKQTPPTRFVRYCCQHLKENTTPNRFAALGVRKAESAGRKGKDIFSSRGATKNEAYHYNLKHVKEVFEDDKTRRKLGGVTNPNESGIWDCVFVAKAKSKDELIINPIYEWTDSDVWMFIRDRKMKHNPLYDMGFSRVGCVGCPLSGNQVNELERYPKYKQNYIKAFDRMLKRRKENGKDDITGKEGLHKWVDGEAVYKWWINDTSIPGQTDIFDFLDKEDGDEEDKDSN